MAHTTPSLESVPATALAKMMYCEYTVTSAEVDTLQTRKSKQDGIAVHNQFEEQLKQSNMILPEDENDSSRTRPGYLRLTSAIAVALALVLLIYFAN